MEHPYRLMNLPSLTPAPSVTSESTQLYSETIPSGVIRVSNVRGCLMLRRLATIQQAPLPEKTARGVATRILMSVQSERVRTYLKSRRTMSSNVVRLLPLTCHSPVTPGFASSTRRQCQRRYCSSSYGNGGRGPTRDMSPLSTFHSCGNSSRLVLRRNRPSGVTRQSFAIL